MLFANNTLVIYHKFYWLLEGKFLVINLISLTKY